MAKYRTKETVEAEKWEPGNIEQAHRLGISSYEMPEGHEMASFQTGGGTATLRRGDYIVTYPGGRRARMTRAEFEDAFEPAFVPLERIPSDEEVYGR